MDLNVFHRIDEVDSGVNSSDIVDPFLASERGPVQQSRTPPPEILGPKDKKDKYEIERYDTHGEDERMELLQDLDLFERAGPPVDDNNLYVGGQEVGKAGVRAPSSRADRNERVDRLNAKYQVR